MPTTPWNHNIAYHPWVMRHAHGDVLDVGCGDGLLVRKLSATCASVTGIDPNVTATLPTIQSATFDDFSPDQLFDTIIFVASLHHMDTRCALIKAKNMLRPGGQILVVGLARNSSLMDWTISGALLPVVKISSYLHKETHDPNMRTAAPTLSLRDIRNIASDVLPGARSRTAKPLLRATHLRHRWIARRGGGWGKQNEQGRRYARHLRAHGLAGAAG